MVKEIELKTLLKFGLIIYPILFYLPPVFITFYYGSFNLHFFGNVTVDFNASLQVLIIHSFLGVALYLIVSTKGFSIYYRVKTSLTYSLFVILWFILFSFQINSYLNIIAYLIFLVCISSYRPSNLTFLVLLILAATFSVVNYSRYPVVMILLIWSLPITAKMKLGSITLLSIVFLFTMIYVLQPLRDGILPFSNSYYGLSYFFQHLSPIYLSAFNSLDFAINWARLISESIPLLRSTLGYDSLIDEIAREIISSEAYDLGVRLGSSNSLYTQLSGLIALPISLAILYFLYKFFTRRIFSNSVLMLLTLYSPYLVRRMFASQLQEIILALILAIIFTLTFMILPKKQRPC